MQTNSRLGYIDIAKGFSIMLMVFGHTYSTSGTNYIITWIYSFHMPLFFLTTGILYGLKARNQGELSWNFQHKFRTLLLPFFLWNTLYQLFISILAIIGGASPKETLINHLLSIIHLAGSAMWFLPAMFIASFIFLSTLKNKPLNITIVFIATFIGLFAPECSNFTSAFLRSFIGLTYIAIGFYGVAIFTTNINKTYTVILFICSLLPALANGTVSISDRTFHNPILYILNGCLGTFIIYQAAMNLKKEATLSHLFIYWGENTIKILCLHGFFIQVIRLIDYKILGNILPCLGLFEGFVFTAIVMTTFTIMLPLINRLLSWSFGNPYPH